LKKYPMAKTAPTAVTAAIVRFRCPCEEAAKEPKEKGDRYGEAGVECGLRAT
jgi:hypothetical protein